MTLVIVFKSESNTNASMDFLYVLGVKSWSVSPNLLSVEKDTGAVLNYPLVNIKTFYEQLPNE